MKRQGFTLLEIIVVLGCMLLLMIPAGQIMRHGIRSSLTGMLQIETTLEGRRILRRVTTDLKQACWEWDDTNKAVYFIGDILNQTGGSFPNNQYSLLSFPQTGNVDQLISQNGDPTKRGHLVNRITYKLQQNTGKSGFSSTFPLFKLIREEQFNPGHPEGSKTVSHVLSDRVLYFQIQPYDVADSQGTTQQFFWVTIKLVDTLNQASQQQVPNANDQLSGPEKNLAIASFFDVAAPEYLASYRQMAGKSLTERSCYNRVTFFSPLGPPTGSGN